MFRLRNLFNLFLLLGLVPMAHATVLLKPLETTLNLGALSTGDNTALEGDDGIGYRIQQAPYFGALHKLVRFTTTFKSPTRTPHKLTVSLKCKCATRGMFVVRTFVADRRNGRLLYGLLNQTLMDTKLNPTYTLYQGYGKGNLARFFALDGEMYVRVEVQQVGFSTVFTNMFDFDQLSVAIEP